MEREQPARIVVVRFTSHRRAIVTPRSIKQTATAADALGLQPIVYEFPCMTCRHAFTDHPRGVCEHMENKKTKRQGGVQCGCREFTGGLHSGHARALRLRQPTGVEWAALSRDYSPIILKLEAPAKELTEEEKLRRAQFYESIAITAITHVRVLGDGGQPKWHAVTVKPAGEHWDPDQWEVSIGELAHPAGNLCWEVGQIVIHDYNYGGPFGGVMPPFRRQDAGAVGVASGGKQPAAVGSGDQQDVPEERQVAAS